MKEIEITCRLNSELNDAKKVLEAYGKIETRKIVDIYFYDPTRIDFKGTIGECLRLRQVNGEHTLSFKVDKFNENGKWSHADVFESNVESVLDCLQRFNDNGFKELLTIENTKTLYEHEKYQVFLEEVVELGNFIELDLDTEEEVNVEEIKADMYEFVKTLNLDITNPLTIGKPELMIKKLGIEVK